MPTIPKKASLTRSSVDVLNAIRNTASANYRDYVPVATPDRDSIRAIGAVIMQFPALQNEFLSSLVNRIGLVLISSKMFSNPWAVFKQGFLEFGETIEEIFVNLAKPFEYDTAVAETKIFAREIPDVRSAFHTLNYQKFYKTTIQEPQLKQAFLSWNGVTDLISKIVDSMYTAANYDEFLTMKYLLAKHILNGELYAAQVPTISVENMKGVVGTIKGVSNNLEFMTTKYNLAGVSNYTTKDNQFIIVNSNFDATMDVEVLASAFNMDKADFMGHRVLVDSFGNLDFDRLDLLLKNDKSYARFTPAEIEALDQVPAVLVDRSWFMIFDNLQSFNEQPNGEGMYWNYWYHVWKTFSVSPFANSVVFVPGNPSVTSVTVSPSAVTTGKGQSVLLTANVVTEYFASKAVKWTHDGGDKVTVDVFGNVTIAPDFDGSTINVTATSVYDETKSAQAVITVT